MQTLTLWPSFPAFSASPIRRLLLLRSITAPLPHDGERVSGERERSDDGAELMVSRRCDAERASRSDGTIAEIVFARCRRAQRDCRRLPAST
jgi:hypothetical protein